MWACRAVLPPQWPGEDPASLFQLFQVGAGIPPAAVPLHMLLSAASVPQSHRTRIRSNDPLLITSTRTLFPNKVLFSGYLEGANSRETQLKP